MVPRSNASGSDNPVVLLLGDSFTYGVGVDNADTYAARLQRLLPHARVGNGGKGTDYALTFVRTRGPALRPRVNVLAFFPNDYCDNANGVYFSIAPEGALRPKPIITRQPLLRRGPPPATPGLFAACREGAEAETRRYLEALHSTSRDMGTESENGPSVDSRGL